MAPTESRAEYLRQYRAKNAEKLKAYEIARAKNPERIARNRELSHTHYLEHTEEVKARASKYHAEHPEETKAYIRAWRDDLFEVWGKLPVSERQVKAHEAELLALKHYTDEGFTVLKTTTHFPVDMLVQDRAGKRWAVEVSVYPRKKFRPYVWALLNFLGLELECFFMRPNLTDFYIMKIPQNQTTISVPKRVVVKGGNVA
jgi:hypothetical protein